MDCIEGKTDMRCFCSDCMKRAAREYSPPLAASMSVEEMKRRTAEEGPPIRVYVVPDDAAPAEATSQAIAEPVAEPIDEDDEHGIIEGNREGGRCACGASGRVKGWHTGHLYRVRKAIERFGSYRYGHFAMSHSGKTARYHFADGDTTEWRTSA